MVTFYTLLIVIAVLPALVLVIGYDHRKQLKKERKWPKKTLDCIYHQQAIIDLGFSDINRQLDAIRLRVHPKPTWVLTGRALEPDGSIHIETLASGSCEPGETRIQFQRAANHLVLEVDAPYRITGLCIGQSRVGVTYELGSREVTTTRSVSPGQSLVFTLTKDEN